ncbi:MAG TPA: glycerophosphodiester phosphodiesterase family protein [Clostridia bacterium]
MKDKWLYERFVAHRGLHGGEIRENTMQAFEAAVKNGYNIELDVQLTKDKVVVVFHDLNLARLTDCDKDVSDLTYEELKKVRYKDSQAGIPAFKDVLKLCEGTNSGLMIEFKKRSLDEQDTELEEIVLPMLKSYKGNFIVKSFNPFSVDFFRTHAPEFTRGFLSDALTIEDYPEAARQMVLELTSDTEKKVDFIDFGVNRLDASEFLKGIEGKMPLIVWTVRSQEVYDKIKNRVNNIIFENFIPKQ